MPDPVTLLKAGSAIAGGLSGLIGGGSGKGRFKSSQNAIRRQRQDVTKLYGKSESALLEALASLEASFQDANRQAGMLGQGAYQRVLDREQQTGANIQQGLASSGLGNTTLQGSLAGALAGQTNRSLLDVDEALAGVRTNLATQKGHALFSGLSDLSRLYEREFGARQSVEQNLISLYSGVQEQTPDYAGGIGKLLGGLSGMFGGGGPKKVPTSPFHV